MPRRTPALTKKKRMNAMLEGGVNVWVASKSEAMAKALRRFHIGDGDPLNVVGIGDSLIEAEAAQEIVWRSAPGGGAAPAASRRCSCGTSPPPWRRSRSSCRKGDLLPWCSSLYLHSSDLRLSVDDLSRGPAGAMGAARSSLFACACGPSGGAAGGGPLWCACCGGVLGGDRGGAQASEPRAAGDHGLLNGVLEKMWPVFSKMVSNLLFDEVEPKLQRAVGHSVAFDRSSGLGAVPLQFGSQEVARQRT
ncbi:unnamed protein product [Prorocentrum cordatum]|uniref:Uncharacterized protein n=1 Tax=Prorocentrum cordatum TaxID=2364126 RepID=A0ABN9V6C4_9DINO|nr:unnamed protein product [Polarella glacialis]